MTEQQIGLLVVQGVVSFTLLAQLGVFLLKAREERHKYRLYATRDKLVYLVATGRLSETSMVFKVFYRAMNTYTAELKSLNLVSFIRASVAVRSELEKENQARLKDAFQRTDPEVRSVINEFIQAVMDALKYNSPTLNLILVLAHHCRRVVHFVKRIKPFRSPIYETYRYYEHIHGQLRTA